MSLRTHLQSIYDKHRTLTPKLVVDTARSKSHPLHSHFEWDDSIAGEKYREVQAGDLIRSVKIQYTKGKGSKSSTRETRYFVSVKKPDSGHSYMPTEDVAQDEILTTIVLRDMEREWQQLKARYGHFKEFVEMIRRDEMVA